MSTLQINHVCLGGKLTREPAALGHQPSGRIFVEFGVLSTSSYTMRDGQKVDRVCYAEIIAWGRLAEMVCNLVHEGCDVVVDGSLVFDQWAMEGGETRSRLRVAATSIYFIGERSSQSEDDGADRGMWETASDEPLSAEDK